MHDYSSATSDWESFGNDLAADVTEAAYSVALGRQVGDEWLDLELDLWKALDSTVQKWEQQVPPRGSPDDFLAWREGLLVELTEVALQVAMEHEIRGLLSEVELDFYQAFRLVLREITWMRWSRSLEAVS